ncbi:MAG: hypothetical protein IPM52_13420 [Bacteroidetes bacterium]|nr:hypothetical protein [Bacteroidota bacterium]
MIRFFKSSFLVQYVALIALALALWLPAILKAGKAQPAFAGEPLYSLLASPVANYPQISVLLAFLLMLAAGFMFNAILSAHGLIPRTSTYGLLFWVIVGGSQPAAMIFQPLWPALLMLLMAFNLAFRMYEQENINFQLFNFGIWVALTALINQAAWVFVIWIFSVLFILRLSRLREWLIPLLALLTTIIYLLIFWFLQNKLVFNLKLFSADFAASLIVPATPGTFQLVMFAFLLMLFFNALSFNYSLSADRNIAMRKRKAMLNSFLIIALGAFFMRGGHWHTTLFTMLPISAHLAIWAGSLSRTARPSFVVWLFLLLALANNILYFSTNA